MSAVSEELNHAHSELVRAQSTPGNYAPQTVKRPPIQQAEEALPPCIEKAIETWADRVLSMKKSIQDHPERNIPELSYATDEDWLEACKDVDFNDEMSVREGLSKLRLLAKNRMIPVLQAALQKYLAANGGKPPMEVNALAPYLDQGFDQSILARYQMTPPELLEKRKGIGKLYLQESQNVDEYFDSVVTFGAKASGSSTVSLVGKEIGKAISQFRKIDPTIKPTSAQIASILHRPVDEQFLRRTIDTYYSER